MPALPLLSAPSPGSPLLSYLENAGNRMSGLLSGLSSCWSGEGCALDPIGGSNGTIAGGLFFWPGKSGQGFLFNGRDSAILIPDSDNLKLDSSLTLSAWVSVWSVKAGGAGQIIFRGDSRPALDPYSLDVLPEPDGRAKVQFHIEGLPAEGKPRVADLFTRIPMRRFVHLTAVLDDNTSQMRLYLDGKLAASSNTPVRPFRNLEADKNPGLALGSTRTPGDQSFHGIIDEVMIYHRALSPGEIQALFEAGKTAGNPPTPPERAKIAFCRFLERQSKIYTMEPDGSHLLRLTGSTEESFFPSWSPDGAQIAYSTRRDGNSQIYVMNADGSDPVRLHTSAAEEYEPSWSPDGTKLAYVAASSGKLDIYTMNANGSGETRLTTSPGDNSQPEWSPDGKKIVFVSKKDGNPEIYLMDADGAHPVRLTNDPVEDTEPTWSPDGQEIGYSHGQGENCNIYVMDSGAHYKIRLTDDEFDNRTPTWSPDGKTIAFQSNRGGNSHLYTISREGGRATRIGDSPTHDEHPRWQPIAILQ